MALDKERKPNRGWLWYFVILAVLTVLATTILVVFNLGQQLKPEQLAAAQKLWEENRPADYVLTYTKKGNASGTFIVTVRHGRVVSVIMREEVVKDNEIQVVEQPLERRLYRNYDMVGLFNDIERFLELDAKKGSSRTYLRAKFDPKNGQLRWFVRSVMGTRDRVEIEVEPIQPPSPEPASEVVPGEILPKRLASRPAPKAAGLFP
jgi:hypothetical protein